jgi:uncharacterized protein YqgC (DUF456 family)
MPEWLDIGVFGVATFFVLVGLFGLLVPFFPGVEVIWITALAYGLVSGFGTLGGWMFALITLIGLFAMVIDNILMVTLARHEGAAWKSLLLGFLGGLVGMVFLPPWGGLIGAPLAVFLFEYLRLKDWKKAWAALRGLAVGWLASLLVRFMLAGAMAGLWLIWALNN